MENIEKNMSSFKYFWVFIILKNCRVMLPLCRIWQQLLWQIAQKIFPWEKYKLMRGGNTTIFCSSNSPHHLSSPCQHWRNHRQVCLSLHLLPLLPSCGKITWYSHLANHQSFITIYSGWHSLCWCYWYVNNIFFNNVLQ